MAKFWWWCSFCLYVLLGFFADRVEHLCWNSAELELSYSI